MFKPSGCSWVTAQPPSECSSRAVLCVHRRTSDTLGIAPLERGRRRVSSLQDVGVFLSFHPRLLHETPRSSFLICSALACTSQKGAGAIFTCANLSLCHDFSFPGLFFSSSCIRRRNKCFECISRMLLFLRANIAYARTERQQFACMK